MENPFIKECPSFELCLELFNLGVRPDYNLFLWVVGNSPYLHINIDIDTLKIKKPTIAAPSVPKRPNGTSAMEMQMKILICPIRAYLHLL